MVRNHHTPPSPDPAGSEPGTNLTRPKFTPTPGPWKLSDPQYANAPAVIFVGRKAPDYSAKYPLNGVDWLAEVRQDESERHPEFKSNALLLAAAPRMLRVLKSLRFHYQTVIGAVTGSTSTPSLDEADALIRELEGGAL